jgi:hypothetical protein
VSRAAFAAMISFRLLAVVGLATAITAGLARSAVAADAPASQMPANKTPAGLDASPSLKIASGGAAPLGAQGFLSRWLVLEPIPGDGRVTDSAVRAAAAKDYFPGQFTVLPHEGDQVAVGGADYTWHAVDSSRHNLNLYHLAYYLGRPTSNVVFWGVTVVESPAEMAGVRLAVGSNAGSVWWLNGQEVVGLYGDRQTQIDDGVSKKLTLRKGANVVRFLVVNNGGMVDCCARFLDAGDRPITALSIVLPASPSSPSPR